jgi:hypothetical protein
MITTAVAVILHDDPAVAQGVADALAGEKGVEVLVLGDPAEARLRLADVTTAMLIFSASSPGASALRAVAGGAALVALLGEDETPPAWADEALPISPIGSEAHARLRGAWRLGLARREAVSLRQQLEASRVRIADVLLGLLDAAVPGAINRGRRAAATAVEVAARFKVPAELLPDLDRAAHLHELGRLMAHGARPADSGAQPESVAWQYAGATRALLGRIAGLEGVAELVGALYENWDGTGFPEHLISGQIPLRSRILRCTLDYYTALAAPGRTPHAVLTDLEDHAGTRYDPAVIVALQAVASGEDNTKNGRDWVRLPIEELRTGMVLIEDLHTDSGIKLLSRGSVISSGALETIRRRHQLEPILQGAAVRSAA